MKPNTTIQLVLSILLSFFALNSAMADDTYSQASGDWNSISWSAGIPVAADNVFISTGHTVTITDLSIDFHITIQSGASLVISNNLSSLNWNYSITNDGTLSVGNTFTADKNLTLTNNDSIYVETELDIVQASIISAASTDIVVNGLVTNNGTLTLGNSAKLQIEDDLSLGTSGAPTTTSSGTITVGGNFTSSNGTFTNLTGSELIISGTGHYLNGSSSSNAGIIDASGEFTVESGDLNNTGGFIYARGDLTTINGGCIDGGGVDFWGTYTNAGCDLANKVSLPVELTSFYAVKVGDAVELNWQTATETDNDRFVIEIANENMDFRTLATVQGNGTSSSTNNYSYRMYNADAGLLYFRLKQYDYDGTFSYSEIISIDMTSKNNKLFYVTKTDKEYLISQKGYTGETLFIYSTDGTFILQSELNDHIISIPLDQLPEGIKVFSISKTAILYD